MERKLKQKFSVCQLFGAPSKATKKQRGTTNSLSLNTLEPQEKNCGGKVHLPCTVKQVATTAILLLCLPLGSLSQNPTTPKDSTHLLQEIVISSSHVDDKTPITTTEIGQEELESKRTESSMPFIVNMAPSIVASGENGQIGNTSMRIRGVDGTRINVNINGIPLNDAESQMVYWVNIPNLAGMAQKIQIQRGLGSSTGGSAAFGGAINLQTLNSKPSPYAYADLSVGSWNTRQYGITAGTGISRHGFALDLAYNGLTSDGYVRNGFCDHQSLFASASHFGEHSLLKALVIIGKQHTGITWNGASAEELDSDPSFNNAGAYLDHEGATHYYDNESDNFWQRHYQLYYAHTLNDRWTLNAAADITRGDGYYEQYFAGGKNSFNYSITDTGDCIARMEMKNTSYAGRLSAQFDQHPINLTFGTMALYYDGDNFGNVVWSQSGIRRDRWYDNQGKKSDITTFVRTEYTPTQPLNIYGDLQLRYVGYSINGTDEDCMPLAFDESYLFLNPQVGAHYDLKNRNPQTHQSANIIVGMSHREPTRADIKDAVRNGDTVKAESMIDIECGYQWLAESPHAFLVKIGGYAMLYNNQLTASGRLNEAGYALMENVDRSYRLGLEMEGWWAITKWLNINGNLTLSTNKIIDYTYHYSDFSGNVCQRSLGNTDLAFSPTTVAAIVADAKPWHGLDIQLSGKYVGKMYCDNTSRDETLQPAYFLLNIKASYLWKLKSGSEIEFQMQINNLLNHHYRLSAWVADYGDDGLFRGFYQQPGTNLTARIALRL